MKRLVLALLLLGSCMPPVSGATRSAEEKRRCLKLESRIAEIRLQRRMGYTAKQGRLSKHKLSTLETEHRASCR